MPFGMLEDHNYTSSRACSHVIVIAQLLFKQPYIVVERTWNLSLSTIAYRQIYD